MPDVLSLALSLDLRPPTPAEWLAMDLEWWESLTGAKGAFEDGRREVDSIAEQDRANREWQGTMLREWGIES